MAGAGRGRRGQRPDGQNALYQVDDTFNPDATWTPGATPFYRIVMTEASRQDLYNIGQTATERWSHAAMNATFISMDGTWNPGPLHDERPQPRARHAAVARHPDELPGRVRRRPPVDGGQRQRVINYNFVGSQRGQHRLSGGGSPGCRPGRSSRSASTTRTSPRRATGSTAISCPRRA